jgi:tRNA(His) 5'-end guanylyltransferase
MSLKNRMKKTLMKLNSGKCHYFKPHIVSIKSYQILNFLNTITTFDEKVKMLQVFQNILYESIKPLYKNCAPNMVYTFLDEVHLVFFYNEHGNYMYDGNIHKIITMMTSSISINVCKQLQARGIDLDFTFTGKIVEFDKDYETLNYLIWRQNDCRRNTMTLLHKCLHIDLFLENELDLNMKLSEIKKDMDKILEHDIETLLVNLLRGNIVKKHCQIYYKIQADENDVMVTRNTLYIENFLFVDNFDKTFEKYVKQLVV